MKNWRPLFLFFLLFLSCQIIPTPPALKATQPVWTTPRPAAPGSYDLTETAANWDTEPGSKFTSPSPLTSSIPTANLPPGELSPFPYTPVGRFAEIEEVKWEGSQVSSHVDVPLPASLDEIENREVVAGLTSRQKAFLERYGFAVVHSQEDQFLDIHERVALYYGQPYFLTTDAAFHAFHLTLSELLPSLEKEELLPRMIALTQATLSMVNSYLPFVQGTSLESDTLLAAAYLGVALRLFDPQAALWPYLEQQVISQVNQVQAGRGVEVSTLFPEVLEDYSAYRPVGHYAGNPSLERYYQGMTWLSRTHFSLRSRPPDSASKVPMLITLALRQASTAEEPAAQEWGRIQELLDFLLGSSLDIGPVEYAKLMDQVYGRRITVIDLFDDSSWETFQTLALVAPSPPIDSIFYRSLEDLQVGNDWGFISRRFNLDDLILQNLVFDRVSTEEKMRDAPSGLDVMAAFGSSAAFQILETSGEISYTGYVSRMEDLRSSIQEVLEEPWQGTLFNSWMNTLIPKLSDRGEEYPSYMRTSAWAYKDLNSSLGGWVDVKNDFATHPISWNTTSEGKLPDYGEVPGFIEADPIVFYRLSHLAVSIAEGLTQRGFVGVFSSDPDRLGNRLLDMLDMGDRLQRLGDIAAKELAGFPLDEIDTNLIHAPLGPAEERIVFGRESNPRQTVGVSSLPPMEGAVAVPGSGDRILELGLGSVDRIYVILPFDGELQVAQGGVYSYYEFLQPDSWPLTDREWRRQLLSSSIERPEWVELFSLPDGNPVDVLAFRIGDEYKITISGGMLNLHESPSLVSPVLRKFQPGERLLIVDGPTQAEDMIWWKFKLIDSGNEQVEGWCVENQEWYERALEP